MDADGVPRRVELPTGELIWVRVQATEPQPGDGGSEGTAPDVGGRGTRRNPPPLGDETQISKLVGFTETVGGIAHSVRNSLAAVRPNRVEVEFGLELDGSTGTVISLVASAHTKASIKVKMAWDHQTGSSDADPFADDPAEEDAEEDAEDTEDTEDAEERSAEDPATGDGLDQEP